MRALQPTLAYGDADWLSEVIARTRDGAAVQRLQGVRFRMMGYSVAETIRLLDVSSEALREWIRRWNDGGVEALATQPRSGRPPAINSELQDVVVEQLSGRLPDGTPYTAVAIHGYLKKKRPGLILGYSTLCRYLKRWDYRRLRPRPHSGKANPAAQVAFVESVRALNQSDDVDFWFGDETGIQANPRPYVVWAKKGSKPAIPSLGEHWHQSVIGAVRPADGRFFSLIVTTGDTDLFQVFLDELNRHIHPIRRTLLILDNVSFHKSGRLRWGRIEPLYLPSYSPELNPIEELWLQSKKRFFNHWIPESEADLEERTANALNYFSDNPAIVKSVCAMTTYFRE